jgi:hypothetical protein
MKVNDELITKGYQFLWSISFWSISFLDEGNAIASPYV